MKKIINVILVIAVIAALAVVGMKLVKNKQAAEALTPLPKSYPIVVETIAPDRSSVTLTLPYLAETINETDVSISSRIASRIESIKKSGDRVKAGERLVQLDTTELNAKIEAAKITLNNQIESYNRTRRLHKVKGASVE